MYKYIDIGSCFNCKCWKSLCDNSKLPHWQCHSTLRRYAKVTNPSDAQIFLFIVEDELERHKHELSVEDYTLLTVERKKLQRHKSANLQKTVRHVFKTMLLHSKNRAINKIDENSYLTQMVPLLKSIDLINVQFRHVHYEKILARPHMSK